VLLVALPVGFFLAGLVIGRWWVVLAALATWGVLAGFLYVNNGWYGAGWGDFGIAFNVMAAVATVVGSIVGVGARRLSGFGRTEPGEIV
jgi:hypothetical protein